MADMQNIACRWRRWKGSGGRGSRGARSCPRARSARPCAGRKTAALAFPGLLHAVAVRSIHAHARLLDVDASAAVALDGVVAFVSRRELEGKVGAFPEPALRDLNPGVHPLVGLEIRSQPMEPLP